MNRENTAAGLLLFAVATGCAGSSLYTSSANGGHHTTAGAGVAGGASSGASSATATSTATGTTGGGTTASASSTTTSGSSTSGAACGPAWLEAWYDGGYLPQPGDCLSNQVELKGRLLDVCNNNAPLAHDFTAADSFNPQLIATTEPCGVYYFCVDAGTELNPAFDVPNYGSLTVATIQLNQSASLVDADGIGLFCTLALQSLTVGLQPPDDPTLATVLVQIDSSDGPPCNGGAGYTLSLLDADGGALDAGTAFVSGLSLTQGDGGTSSYGVQVFYDIDPSLGPISVAPQGGACPTVSNYLQFTGSIPLLGGIVTFYVYGAGL